MAVWTYCEEAETGTAFVEMADASTAIPPAAASPASAHEGEVLALLRARNCKAAPALAATKAAELLLAECAALEASNDKQQQGADLLLKERHEMLTDMELLRENEANSGVSREHIDHLHDMLEASKSEAAQRASEAAAARASNTETSEAARLMGEKLAEAQAKAADQEHSLKLAASREEALKAENARLIERLTTQLQAEAMAMDSEREHHEARLVARNSGGGSDDGLSASARDAGGSRRATATANVEPTPVD